MNLNSLITAPARLGLTLGSRAIGLIRSRLGGGRIDDATLQRSVEAEVLASRRAPKGKVEVAVTEGVVWLRGEVKAQAAVDELETRARSVEGVARVENLLRVAKAQRAKPAARAKAQKRPAPKRSARPKPAAATAPPPEAEPTPAPTPPPAAQREREVTRRFNAEQTSGSDAEPTPRNLSEAGEGRQPAPLGSEEPAGEPAGVGSPAAPFPTTSGPGGPGPSENGASGGGGELS